MPVRRLLLVLSPVLAAAFSPAAAAIDVRDYFPTPNGATWTYAFSDWSPASRCSGQRTVRVAAAASGTLKLVTVAIGTASCAGAAQQQPVTTSTETFAVGGTGHRLMSRDGSPRTASEHYEWSPAMLVLPTRADIFQAFQSAGVVNEADGNQMRAVGYQATLKYLGVENVTVPAGAFPAALHLQLIEIRDSPLPPASQIMVRTDRWLGRAVGAVKIKTEVLVNGKVVRSTLLHLACSSLTDVQSTKCGALEQAGGTQ
jgi:hypothetical protein